MSKFQYKWFGKEDLSELEKTLKEEEIPVEREFESELGLGEEKITTKLDYLIAESDNVEVHYNPKKAWLDAGGRLTEKDRKNLKIVKERYPHSKPGLEVVAYGVLAAGVGSLIGWSYLSLIGL